VRTINRSVDRYRTARRALGATLCNPVRLSTGVPDREAKQFSWPQTGVWLHEQPRICWPTGAPTPCSTQHGLDDTMLDLVFNTMGSVVVAVWGTVYLTDVVTAVRDRLEAREAR